MLPEGFLPGSWAYCSGFRSGVSGVLSVRARTGRLAARRFGAEYDWVAAAWFCAARRLHKSGIGWYAEERRTEHRDDGVGKQGQALPR